MNENCWYKDVCTKICTDSCIRYLEMKYLMDSSGIPKSKQKSINLSPDNSDYDAFFKLLNIKNNIVEFVNNGDNLYITSRITGNGKTSWAIKILMKYFNEIWVGNGFRTRGLFIHVPTLLIKLKNFENPLSNTYKQDILNADLVIWDDIASTDMSNYDYNQLLMYIDQRLLYEKSNIYTGNINSVEGMNKALGSKLASRIYNNSIVIEFVGEDRRNG